MVLGTRCGRSLGFKKRPSSVGKRAQERFQPCADPLGGQLQIAMKAATIMVAAEESPSSDAAGNGEGGAAGSAAAPCCQRYYMDHMPLSTVQDVADPEQYVVLCKVRCRSNLSHCRAV